MYVKSVRLLKPPRLFLSFLLSTIKLNLLPLEYVVHRILLYQMPILALLCVSWLISWFSNCYDKNRGKERKERWERTQLEFSSDS